MMESVPLGQLGGAAEVAECLGCHKQQITKLKQRCDFPPPVAVLAATPVWDLRQVREFRDSWKRRPRTLDSQLVS